MKSPETVGIAPRKSSDPLILKQRQDVANMRASLLCCSDDPTIASQALKKIAVLRVYHQISRIIRYLEMMDKIEEKMYESIEAAMDRMDSDSPVTWMTLINLQEKLQNNLINSHKLLQPYLNVEEFGLEDMLPTITQASENKEVLPKVSRDKLRIGAQQALAALEELDSDD